MYTLRDIYAFVFTFIAALDGRDLLANSIACVYLWDIFYVCIFVVLSLADCNTSYALLLRLNVKSRHTTIVLRSLDWLKVTIVFSLFFLYGSVQ